MAEVVDVVVAGGGPAGCAAAIALARAGRRVLLAEAAPGAPAKVGESLPPAARPALRALGALDAVEAGGRHLRSPGTTAVWGGPLAAGTDHLLDPSGTGWHLDRAAFERELREVAAGLGIAVRSARVTGLAPAGPRAERSTAVLRPADGGAPERVGCRWLVDATGRRAALARAGGARRARTDRLVALVARLPAGAGDADARTRVAAAPDGWWYSALVPGSERVVALLTDADLLDGRARTAEGFAAAMAPVRDQLAVAHDLTPSRRAAPQATAAHSARLLPAMGEGWTAAGDAALAFDPLSSQGLLNALLTGLLAGQAVDRHLAGDPGALPAYADRLAAVHAAYAANLATAYRQERRWMDRPFWARRA